MRRLVRGQAQQVLAGVFIPPDLLTPALLPCSSAMRPTACSSALQKALVAWRELCLGGWLGLLHPDILTWVAWLLLLRPFRAAAYNRRGQAPAHMGQRLPASPPGLSAARSARAEVEAGRVGGMLWTQGILSPCENKGNLDSGPIKFPRARHPGPHISGQHVGVCRELVVSHSA